MRRRQAIFAMLLCVLTCACSSDSEKFAKEIKEANSWIASARMVAGFYNDGAVPKPYARDSLDSFMQQLESSAKRIQSIPDARAPQAASALQRAQDAIARMNTAIDQTDRLSLAQFDLQLENEQRTLSSLVESTGNKPPQP
jgi:hypothetical protein